MSSRHIFLTVAVLGLVASLGAGCSVSALRDKFSGSSTGDNTTSTKEVTGPQVAMFDGLSPVQAAQKIQFVGSSVIVMQQGFNGIGGQLAQKLGFGGNAGTRTVVIRSYSPQTTAEIEWKLSTKVAPDPKIPKDTGERQTTGSLVDAKLLSAHKLYLPGYWPEAIDKSAFDTSLIWLSAQNYADLSKNKVTTLDLGVTDELLSSSFAGASAIKSAVQKIRGVQDTVGTHTDIYTMTADPQPSTMTLKVNGKNVTVQVLKARNWFGEITVLDNKLNPLVLDVTLDPLMLAAADATAGSGFMKTALGYHITELQDIVQAQK